MQCCTMHLWMILLYSLTGKNRFTVYCIDFMPNKNDIRVTDQTHVPSLNCNSNTFRSLKLTYLSWVEVKSNFSPTNHDATHHCPLVTSSKTVFTFSPFCLPLYSSNKLPACNFIFSRILKHFFSSSWHQHNFIIVSETRTRK